VKVHSLMTAAIVVAAALAATHAAAADGTIVTLDRKYSVQELAALCALENAAFYRGVEGRYGCTTGENNVDCAEDGACIGYFSEPFAETGAERVGAEQVLAMPIRSAAPPPVGSEVSGIVGLP